MSKRFLSRRKKDIIQALGQSQQMAMNDLAANLEISNSTLRRELVELAEMGLVQRKFGIVSLSFAPEGETPYLLRHSLFEDEKKRIARAALEMVRNGETIFISGGTTTYELAHLLPSRRQVTVITNALPVANAVVDRPGIQLVILGGVVRRDEQTMHGHLTLYGAEQLHADKLFYGIEAINLEYGLTHSQLIEVSTDRALLKLASETIVMADHTKFDKVAPALVRPLSDIHCIITGNEAPADLVEAITNQKVRVILA